MLGLCCIKADQKVKWKEKKVLQEELNKKGIPANLRRATSLRRIQDTGNIGRFPWI